MKRRQNMMALAGLVAIAVTLILFFLPGGEREAVDWACLTFLLLAELVLAGGGILADRAADKAGGVFFRAGAFSALLICTIVSAAVSLVSVLWMRPPVAGLVGVQIVLFATGFILLIALSAAGRHAGEREAAEERDRAALMAMVSRACTLAGAPANREHTAQLERVAEALRYADAATESPLDEQISEKLAELEAYLNGDAAADEVSRRTEELLWTIERRGREVKEGKAGKT